MSKIYQYFVEGEYFFGEYIWAKYVLHIICLFIIFMYSLRYLFVGQLIKRVFEHKKWNKISNFTNQN